MMKGYDCLYCGSKNVPIDTQVCPSCHLRPIPPFVDEDIYDVIENKESE